MHELGKFCEICKIVKFCLLSPNLLQTSILDMFVYNHILFADFESKEVYSVTKGIMFYCFEQVANKTKNNIS